MSKVIKDPQIKIWNKWRDKISALSEQIFELKTDGQPDVIAVSKFILTCQLVEFQLRELLLSLGFNEWLKSGKEYISDPADFDNDKRPYTLGKLVNKELIKYTNETGVKRLLSQLRNLNKQRKQFVHGLFGSHLQMKKLQPLSIKGFALGQSLLLIMSQLERKINDKQDKYLTRIKKLKNPTPKEEILRRIWVGKVKQVVK